MSLSLKTYLHVILRSLRSLIFEMVCVFVARGSGQTEQFVITTFSLIYSSMQLRLSTPAHVPTVSPWLSLAGALV